MCKKILIFAGTLEGRKLCEYCTKHKIYADVSVATDYGKELIPPSPYLNVLSGRMEEGQMKEQIAGNPYLMVIDATHPYAKAVTQNLVSACKALHARYIRVLREEKEIAEENFVYVDSIAEAVKYLNKTTGNILVTTGSKELSKYSGLSDYGRLYVRVLPSRESLDACLHFGLSPKNVICMQGPFTKELNTAMLRQLDCRYLVTKDSGREGGFDAKIQAAASSGVTAIVVRRPDQVAGYRLEQIIHMLEGLA